MAAGRRSYAFMSNPHAEEPALARVSKHVFPCGATLRDGPAALLRCGAEERLGRQFARAFGGGSDRARQNVLDRVLANEDLKRGGGDALRRGHFLPELTRRKVGARQQLAGALDRRPRQLTRKRGIESGGTTRFFK